MTPERLDQPHPPSLSPRGLAIAGWSAFLLAGLVFLALAWSVSAQGSLVALDERVAQWLRAHGSPVLVAFFLGVTHLNSTLGIALWSAAFGAVLARLRERYWVLTLVLAVGGGMLLNVLLKAAYERMRPRFDLPVLELSSFSFPSGHTAGAVLFYGVLAAFLVSRTRDRGKRIACIAGAIAAVVLVAFSRVYLGAHYVSDVVAAACSSIAWLALCLSAGHALVRGKLRLRWILAGALTLVMVACAVVLPLEDWSNELQQMLEDKGPVTGLLIFCAANVVGTLLLVPGWIFPLVAGAALGFGWGLVASLIGAAASALAAFLIARYVVRGRIEQRVCRHPSFAPVNNAVKREPWTTVALMRMSPVLPSGIKSYCFGLMQLDTWTYLGASLAGMLPGILLKVYVGSAGRDALGSGGPGKWALFAAGLAATAGLAWVLRRTARKRLSMA